MSFFFAYIATMKNASNSPYIDYDDTEFVEDESRDYLPTHGVFYYVVRFVFVVVLIGLAVSVLSLSLGWFLSDFLT